MKRNYWFMMSILLILSCAKQEGEGGLAKIKGKVFAFNLNSDGHIADSAYVGEQKIYISYGDHTFVDDEVRTSYDGSYQFDNLNKGNYRIFTYSYCNQCPLNQEVIKVDVEISSKKQTLELPDLKIFLD